MKLTNSSESLLLHHGVSKKRLMCRVDIQTDVVSGSYVLAALCAVVCFLVLLAGKN